MPHQIIEYSANLEERIDVQAVVKHLHRAAAQQEVLPLAGLRTRAYACAHFAIADEHPDNAFIAVYLRIGQGRDTAVRKALGEALATSLHDSVTAYYDSQPLALSYEIQEIETAMRWNQNNLRDYIKERTHE